MSDLRRLLALLLLLPTAAVQASPLPDPMRPPTRLATRVASDAPQVTLVLNSTLVAAQRRVATINGRRYRLGDAVGDGKLVAIEPTAVELERDGRRIRLELLPSRVRRAADR